MSTGVVTFDPIGSAQVSDGGAAVGFEELQGIVRQTDTSAGTVLVDAYHDDQLTLLFARFRIQVDPLTLLLTESDTVYLTPGDFLDDLVRGASVVEVHGELDLGGAVAPRWIRVQDLTGSVPRGSRVELEGRIVGSTTGTEFDLRINEIVEGASVALPVLGTISGPTVRVALGPLTRTIVGAGDVVARQSLAVGQAVKVAFGEFLAEPFPAALVVVDELEPRFDGRITDIAGLPAAAELHLDANEPALVAGLVTSTTTDVALDLTGSTIVLDLDQEPVLLPSQLMTDLGIRVRGTLSGPPGGPNLQALETVIVPGRVVDAQVATIDEPAARFTTSGGTFSSSFGGMVLPGPLTVVIDPLAVFGGDASTQAEFFALFNGLGTGEMLVVEALGIGSGVPNEVRAYEIRAEVL